MYLNDNMNIHQVLLVPLSYQLLSNNFGDTLMGGGYHAVSLNFESQFCGRSGF